VTPLATVAAAGTLNEGAADTRTRRIWLGLQLALVTTLIAALYAEVFPGLVSDWWNDDGASHGFLIPPFAAYLAWRGRRGLRETPAGPDARGLLVVIGACLAFLAGRLGAEFFVTRVSFVVLLAGLAWTFWGLARLRALALPLLLLVTMVPLPAILYNSLSAPLQLFASRCSEQLLHLVDVPVYRDGNILHLSEISLGIAEACSGLRSLASLLVLALLTGFLWCSGLPARATLMVLAIPIAITVNVLRVAGTALLADRNSQLALGFYHGFSGWLIFVAGFVLLLATAKALHALLDRAGPTEPAL